MQLASVLDLRAAAPLWSALSAARGQALCVDASAVERVGGLCLQLLLGAQAQWRAEGVSFKIENPSTGFVEAIKLAAAEELIAEAA